jgi:hypothetical protein
LCCARLKEFHGVSHKKRKALKMINRYAGEIRINPIAILRNHDFNNEGEIDDILKTIKQAIDLNNQINDRLQKLMAYLVEHGLTARASFNFAPGGYIAMRGFRDDELQDLNKKGLIDLFDFASDRDWVKKYGARFGLIWENGRAVSLE